MYLFFVPMSCDLWEHLEFVPVCLRVFFSWSTVFLRVEYMSVSLALYSNLMLSWGLLVDVCICLVFSWNHNYQSNCTWGSSFCCSSSCCWSCSYLICCLSRSCSFPGTSCSAAIVWVVSITVVWVLLLGELFQRHCCFSWCCWSSHHFFLTWSWPLLVLTFRSRFLLWW